MRWLCVLAAAACARASPAGPLADRVVASKSLDEVKMMLTELEVDYAAYTSDIALRKLALSRTQRGAPSAAAIAPTSSSGRRDAGLSSEDDGLSSGGRRGFETGDWENCIPKTSGCVGGSEKNRTSSRVARCAAVKIDSAPAQPANIDTVPIFNPHTTTTQERPGAAALGSLSFSLAPGARRRTKGLGEASSW